MRNDGLATVWEYSPPMTICRAQVAVQATSADSEDVIVNNWYFDITNAETEGNITPVATALDNFYSALTGYFSPSHAWPTGKVKFYNIADPPPRAPLYDATLAVTSGLGTNHLPRECAVVLSFQGTQISGIPQRRRRGRVYLGPWSQNANDSATGMVAGAVVTAVKTAAEALLLASATASGWAWIVHSETSAGNSEVDNGWVDNAWDIQRRRGVDATSRVTF